MPERLMGTADGGEVRPDPGTDRGGAPESARRPGTPSPPLEATPPLSRRRPRRADVVTYRVRIDLMGTRPPLGVGSSWPPTCSSGKIRSVKDGGHRKILPEWIDDYIRRVIEEQAA